MKRFLLVDDHVIVRSGIKELLSEIFSSSEIHEACDGDSTVEKLKSHQYELVVMDVKMLRTDTLGLLQFIHANYSDAKVLIFSMCAENIYARRFLRAGAKGFVSKGASPEEIKKAVTLILNGSKYISEPLALVLADESLSEEVGQPF
jgi:two-component system, NarL family, invasion response regulator UvrY